MQMWETLTSMDGSREEVSKLSCSSPCSMKAGGLGSHAALHWAHPVISQLARSWNGDNCQFTERRAEFLFWISKSYNQDNQQRRILFFFYYSGPHLMASRPFCRSFHRVDQLQTWLGENTEVTSAITSANGQKVPRLSPVGLWLAPGQELCYRCCVALDLQPHIAVTTLPTEIVISVLFSLKMQWRHWKITLSFINLLYSSHAFSDDWLGCFVREQLSAFSPLLSSDPLSPCSATQ